MTSHTLPNLSEDLHENFGTGGEDPYQSLRFLGHGGGGSVDEVVRKGDPTGERYARKQVILRWGSGNQEKINQLREEARIIRQLHHRHVIKLIGTYTWATSFGIIMDPVAETDLQQFLSHVDSMEDGEQRRQACSRLFPWVGCLIRCLDYLHEMRVKHRDIKPSNFLIKGDTIYYTDFGISRIVSDEFTTGTDGTFGDMTPAYVAPEVLIDDARRGRTMDVFSLGCVLLEMSTVIIGSPGSRERFRRFRLEKTGTVAYAKNPLAILQWIWHLWGLWSNVLKWIPFPPDRYARHGIAIPDLAFLMLDPNPSHRITSRQLVALISASESYYFNSVNSASCDGCRISHRNKDHNLPLHSVFKHVDDLAYPEPPEQALLESVAPNWEVAKRMWLRHHMWW
jgi:serine/threonine protein kinase